MNQNRISGNVCKEKSGVCFLSPPLSPTHSSLYLSISLSLAHFLIFLYSPTLCTILWFYQSPITLFPQCSFSCTPSLLFYPSLIILFFYSFLHYFFRTFFRSSILFFFCVLHSPYVLLLSEGVLHAARSWDTSL
jgi:hypothetical protein